MTERPNFVNDLRSQLEQADLRLLDRQRRVRRLMIGVGGLIIVAVGSLTALQLTNRSERSDTVIAGSDVPPGRGPSSQDPAATETDSDHLATPPGNEACIPPPTQPNDTSLVGLPVGEVWPGGFRQGFQPGEPAYVVIRDPRLEGDWYGIGAVVYDLGGRALGTGVWLLPDPIASFAGVGEPGDPADDPANWHLYSFNDLAEQSSIWQPSPVDGISTDPPHAVEGCLGNTPTPLPFIAGSLLDGDHWILTDDPDHGLCLVSAGADYGCDDNGPVVSPGDPPETMRIATTLNIGPDLEEGNAGDLAYGYLPSGASSVELIMPDGTSFTTDVVLNLDARLWGAPIQPGNNPASVRYVDNQGRVVNETEPSE